MTRSRRGSTQAGVRWNSTRRAAAGWISGTIWIADAPVPATATRLPSSRAPWSQRAEWNTSPGNSASPGMSGRRGSESGPAAEMRTSAVRPVWAAGPVGGVWPGRGAGRPGARDPQPPARQASVPAGLGDLRPQSQMAAQAVAAGDLFQVVPDLWLPAEAVRPAGVGGERERVQVRRDVAGAPGVGVVPPG